MLQDKNGYMWFATENGVSRFDGYEFKNFTTHDGLPANSTIRVYEDYKGRIWFASYKGPLSYYENEKITAFELNQEIINLNISDFFDNIYIDSTETMWLSPSKRGLYSISSRNELKKEYIEVDAVNLTEYTLFYFYENGEVIPWTLSKNDISKHSEQLNAREINSIQFSNYNKHHYYQNYYFEIGNNDYFFSLGTTVKRIKNGKVIFEKKYKNEILAIFQDTDQNLWISEHFNCLYMYPNGDIFSEPIEFLANTSVTHVLLDSEGNYWFSTTEKGVYFVPSIQFKNYDQEYLKIDNDLIISLVNCENQLFFTTNNKGIHSFFIENNGIVKNKNFNIEGFSKSNINDLLITSGKFLWVSDSEFFKYNLDGSKISKYQQEYFVGHSIKHLNDKSVVLAHRTGISKYVNEEAVYHSENNGFSKQVFCLNQTKDSTLLLGTYEGLYKFKNGKYCKYDSTCEVLNNRISDIKFADEDLWIGTFNNGIVIDTGNGFTYINQETGLISNRIKVIFVENEKNIWLGTNKGLCHVNLSETTQQQLTIVNYTIWDGLPANEINDILKYNDLIWLATDKGLVSFNPSQITKSSVPPILNIENVVVNQNHINLHSHPSDFESNENNITFYYKGISYKNPGNLNYYYKLQGLEENWLKTTNTSVRYPDLNYGDYNFVVKAQNANGTFSTPKNYNFSISKHFTQTVFFTVVLILCGLGIVFVIFFIVLRNFKKREKLKQQVILAEQTALRAQMNPHFIFNSLSSIHDMVLNKDVKNANLYLSNFSTLMRRTLENSKNNTISLREEINTIKTYIDLEKLRFETLFDYKINIDHHLDLDDIFIPTLLLQTYIENAIWHGLAPKNKDGLLTIDFQKKSSNEVIISITDNGIGRKKAYEISNKRNAHTSTGMKNSEERVQLLNKLNKSSIKIDVIDLYNSDKIPEGTIVEITISN
jgi:ligand-binding sensor domain-containing protein